jgi:hypothetical protein
MLATVGEAEVTLHARETSAIAYLFVNDCIIVEVKAAMALANEHVAQTLNYLKATGIDLGLLVNFGRPKLEFKRLVFEQVRLVCSASSASSAANSPRNMTPSA